VEDVRRAHERSAEERVAELARANAVIRGNLERLAHEPDLHAFLGHMLLETARQFDAASGSIIVAKESLQEWRILAHVRNGQLETPLVAVSAPFADSSLTAGCVPQCRAHRSGDLAGRSGVPPPRRKPQCSAASAGIRSPERRLLRPGLPSTRPRDPAQ